MRILKYTLEITDQQTIRMPRGARILTAQLQTKHQFGGLIQEELQVWALVDDDMDIVMLERTFAIYGTGHHLPESTFTAHYISTVQDTRGGMVWHIFEI